MDIAPLLGTLLGGLIGVGSTAFVDRLRARRDQDSRSQELQREAFSCYLAAVSEASVAMRQASRDAQRADQDVGATVYESLVGSRVYPAYHTLAVVAEEGIVAQANIVLVALERARDLLIAGVGVEAPDYRDARATLLTQLATLRNFMRQGLGLKAIRSLPDGTP
ncbi:hypothetical protein [Streptomyces sp. SP17KL33]|uniref:hypothetical protein n=1 Tax=Streptomyces sp. SP17KL33 TaxID=3002534 RepID=UPI002E759D9F|nr:hypothetical protein [Streptomyces sp. SP17KL33]MEE1834475.1 hypothetical protein [Streptomyces sp. SP17KL33]